MNRFGQPGRALTARWAAAIEDPAELVRSGTPMALLIVAAAVTQARAFVLPILLVGAALAFYRDAPARWAWAASLPVAVNLCWRLLPAPVADPFGADCTILTSPPAIWRALEATVTLSILAAAALVLGVGGASIGLRMPRRSVALAGLGGAVLLGPVGLALGPLIAGPFFGPIGLDLSDVGFLLPALVFGLANGVMEEVSYRGALLAWTARVGGVRFALVGQAVVFGLAHGGPDVGGAPFLLMLLLGLGGLLAGIIALRTRSLLVPIAWHVALDLPLYVYLACVG